MSTPRKDTYAERCREGENRNHRWQILSNTEKLNALDRRLGKGVGAKRQRALLTVNLEKKS